MPPLVVASAARSIDDDHFEFGRNWTRFLSTLDDRRIAAAKESLQSLLHVDTLEGRRFLDAGCGSGLFSLAASLLGAEVVSFDLDAHSVACAQELKRRYRPNAENWTVRSGSLTDPQFLHSLETFDIVYCWGVAHHTGRMWDCIAGLLPLVNEGGLIALAIYNDQLYISRAWGGVKRIYQSLPRFMRPIYAAVIGAALFLKRLATTLVASLLRLATLRNPLVPFLNWTKETQARGMHAWYDLVDWVGGWPFETARPEDVFRFLRDRGFTLRELTTSPGHGCNEFVFVRTSGAPAGNDA